MGLSIFSSGFVDIQYSKLDFNLLKEMLSELKSENMNYKYILVDYSTPGPDNCQSFIPVEDDHICFLRSRIGDSDNLIIGNTKGDLELPKEISMRHSYGRKIYFMDVEEKIEKEVSEERKK